MSLCQFPFWKTGKKNGWLFCLLKKNIRSIPMVIFSRKKNPALHGPSYSLTTVYLGLREEYKGVSISTSCPQTYFLKKFISLIGYWEERERSWVIISLFSFSVLLLKLRRSLYILGVFCLGLVGNRSIMVIDTYSLQKLLYLITHLFVKSCSGIKCYFHFAGRDSSSLGLGWLAQGHRCKWCGSLPGLLTHSSVLSQDHKTKKPGS